MFEESTEIKASWLLHHHEGAERITSNKLYSYSLDTPPDCLDSQGKCCPPGNLSFIAKLTKSQGIVEVGNLLVNYEDVNLDRFEYKTNSSGKRVWQLPILVRIKLGARQGTFTFKTSMAGQECGVAHMDFSEH